ncbi:MAG: hypothetical protein NDI90_20605 [Nitrospira sp. BO4]|nr:hypothetical protein [Nitrospira sp. BO4]
MRSFDSGLRRGVRIDVLGPSAGSPNRRQIGLAQHLGEFGGGERQAKHQANTIRSAQQL